MIWRSHTIARNSRHSGISVASCAAPLDNDDDLQNILYPMQLLFRLSWSLKQPKKVGTAALKKNVLSVVKTQLF